MPQAENGAGIKCDRVQHGGSLQRRVGGTHVRWGKGGHTIIPAEFGHGPAGEGGATTDQTPPVSQPHTAPPAQAKTRLPSEKSFSERQRKPHQLIEPVLAVTITLPQACRTGSPRG